MNKKRLVRWFVDWTDSWNREFHEAIESKGATPTFEQRFRTGCETRKNQNP